jgi:[acyl-carrier-protein] S-malonyltransferase
LHDSLKWERNDEAQSMLNLKKMSLKNLLDNAKEEKTEAHKEADVKKFQRPQNQSEYAFRPQTDPRDTSILLFPGQGAQFVGMGQELKEYPNVMDMFAVASDILGYDLLDICLNGPLDQLSRTVYQQPAIFVTSLAAVEKLRVMKPNVGILLFLECLVVLLYIFPGHH